MRDTPLSIDRISMITAPDLVIHSSARHSTQSSERHFESRVIGCAGIVTEQKVEVDWPAELRSPAESRIVRIVASRNALIRGIENRGADIVASRGCWLVLQVPDHLVARFDKF